MWQMRIQDPSGETRLIRLKNGMPGGLQAALTLGTGEHSDVLLRDPTVAKQAAVIWAVSPEAAIQPSSPKAMRAKALEPSPWWLKIADGAPLGRLGDLNIREAHLPAHLPLRIGESVISIEPDIEELALPTQPAGVRPWLTACEEGRKTLWMAKKAAATPLSIYIAGETGTGKEVIANLLHSWSDRASGHFVPINCGALPLALAESELFGHVKGAFTGAATHRAGALMQAHNGTLFLDEIGDLPLDIQVKLLRFLENGEIRPVGADRPSRADVRILCATHQPLKALVEAGRFRRDLYYRLASVTIEIPPLRHRPDDIAMLATRFAGDMSRAISERAMLRLQAHAWPGNVRELRHAVERASGLAGPFSPVLGEEAFEFLLTNEHIEQTPELELGAPVLTLEEMERVLILKSLRLSKGNRAKAAKILGIARSTLFEMLKRHRIQGPRASSSAHGELSHVLA